MLTLIGAAILKSGHPYTGGGVGQDHVRIILLQNWAVALDANVWTSSQQDSLMSRINIPQFLI